MLSISAANTADLPTRAAPQPPKTIYRLKTEAKAAAVAEIGPHAREGFEYTVDKVDGAWRWRVTDTPLKAPSQADLKASGGKRSILAMAAELADRAHGKPATPEVQALAAVAASKPAADEADIPAFLKREGKETDAQRDARIAKHKRVIGPDRAIKNPPSVKQAKKAAAKRGAGGTSKAALIGQLLLRKEGCTTADVLKATGWPSVSMPAQAKMVGLKLRKEKEGKVTRYYGVPKK